MIKYGNVKSGVVEYDLAVDAIALRFVSGTTYVYTEDTIGPAVHQLQRLARDGKGLNTFLNHNVKIRNGYKFKITNNGVDQWTQFSRLLQNA